MADIVGDRTRGDVEIANFEHELADMTVPDDDVISHYFRLWNRYSAEGHNMQVKLERALSTLAAKRPSALMTIKDRLENLRK